MTGGVASDGPAGLAMVHSGWGGPTAGTTAAPAGGRGRCVDAVVAIALWAAHAMVAMGATMVVGLAVMGLDPCGYRACGNPLWANIGLSAVVIAAWALPVADLMLILLRLVKNRPAWPVPLAFCAAHVAVGVMCFALMVASGPQ